MQYEGLFSRFSRWYSRVVTLFSRENACDLFSLAPFPLAPESLGKAFVRFYVYFNRFWWCWGSASPYRSPPLAKRCLFMNAQTKGAHGWVAGTDCNQIGNLSKGLAGQVPVEDPAHSRPTNFRKQYSWRRVGWGVSGMGWVGELLHSGSPCWLSRENNSHVTSQFRELQLQSYKFSIVDYTAEIGDNFLILFVRSTFIFFLYVLTG